MYMHVYSCMSSTPMSPFSFCEWEVRWEGGAVRWEGGAVRWEGGVVRWEGGEVRWEVGR